MKMTSVAAALVHLLTVFCGHSMAGDLPQELKSAVLHEVINAQRSGVGAPTCEDLRVEGQVVAKDPAAAELMFAKALSLKVISHASYSYFTGLVSLARSGADFDRIADWCSKALPGAQAQSAQRTFKIIRKPFHVPALAPADYPVYVM